jgi:hypothetical protein
MTKKLDGESLTLANDIGPAYAAVTEAEGGRDTANNILVEKTKVLAALLLRGHALHPGIKPFEAFLEQVPDGPKATRAYEIMKIAKGGPAVAEKLAQENARRQKELRDRRKLEREEQAKKLPKPEPKPVPANEDEDEDEAEVVYPMTARLQKALNDFMRPHGDLDGTEEELCAALLVGEGALVPAYGWPGRPAPVVEQPKPEPSNVIPLRHGTDKPVEPLAAFKQACDTFLPLLDEEDLLAAVNYMDKVVRTISTPEKRSKK